MTGNHSLLRSVRGVLAAGALLGSGTALAETTAADAPLDEGRGVGGGSPWMMPTRETPPQFLDKQDESLESARVDRRVEPGSQTLVSRLAELFRAEPPVRPGADSPLDSPRRRTVF
jgi:hypothetical protein